MGLSFQEGYQNLYVQPLFQINGPVIISVHFLRQLDAIVMLQEDP